MAVSLPDITAKVRLDTSGLDGAVRNSRSALGGLGGAIKGVGIVAAAAAAGGVYLLGKGIKASIDNAAEGQRIMAETGRVIQSMGAGSWTSSEQVAQLSSRLGRLSAAGDEAVQEAANMLLTFGSVRNELGKGNDVFDRATGLTLDLARVLGTDAKGGALQLGKALQDPVKGITALSRAGVSFTEQQKAQIKAMVAAGDILGAQKIILAEVERQVGGAAEAYGKTFVGALERAGNAVGDMSELLGGPLIDALGAPLASGFADWLERVHDILEPVSKRLSEMFTRLDVGGRLMAKLQPALDAVEGFLRDLAGRFERVSGEIEAAIARGDWAAVRGVLQQMLNDATAGLRLDLTPVFAGEAATWEEAKAGLGGRIKDAIFAAIDSLTEHAADLAGKLGALMIRVITSPEFAGSTTGALSTAWVDSMRRASEMSVGEMGAHMGTGLSAAVVLALSGHPFLGIGVAFMSVGPIIQEGTARITEHIVNFVATGVEKFVLFAARIGETLFAGSIRAGEMVGQGLIIITQRIAGWVGDAAMRFVNFGAQIGETLFRGAINAGEAFMRGIHARWPAVIQWFRDLPNTITNLLAGIGGWLAGAGADLVRGFLNGMMGVAGWIAQQVRNFVRNNIINPVKETLGLASPSKLFAGFGVDIGRGLAAGIRRQTGEVQRAAAALHAATLPAAAFTPALRLAGPSAARMATMTAAAVRHPAPAGPVTNHYHYNTLSVDASGASDPAAVHRIVDRAFTEFQRRYRRGV